MTTLFTVVLIFLLAAISYIDIQQMRIPNVLNMLLASAGISYWVLSSKESLPIQLASGLGFALMIWLVRFGYLKLTGRVGLGLGDIKMAGAGAVWINPLLLPFFLFSASASGLVYALIVSKPGKNERMPFGPFLAVGLISSWMAENFI